MLETRLCVSQALDERDMQFAIFLTSQQNLTSREARNKNVSERKKSNIAIFAFVSKAIMFLSVKKDFYGNHLNPYKPSILFMGYRQIVHSQIRGHRMWHLIMVSTVCLQIVQLEF